MKTLVCVMAHGGAQAVFNRHLKYWQAHNHPILTFCPSDDTVVGHGTEVVSFGRAGHHDASSLERFKYLLRLLTTRKEDWFALFEYDSICLSPALPDWLYVDGIWGNVHHEPHHSDFLGSRYLHPPLFFGRAGLEKIVATGDKYPQHFERNYWDRWVGLMAELGGVVINSYGNYGFSHNTIEPDYIPGAVEAARYGCLFFHGIKTQGCLDAIVNA